VSGWQNRGDPCTFLCFLPQCPALRAPATHLCPPWHALLPLRCCVVPAVQGAAGQRPGAGLCQLAAGLLGIGPLSCQAGKAAGA